MYSRNVPESPRFLLSRKRHKEVDNLFKRIAFSNNKVYETDFDAILSEDKLDIDDQSLNSVLNNEIHKLKTKFYLFLSIKELLLEKPSNKSSIHLLANRKIFLRIIVSLLNWYDQNY